MINSSGMNKQSKSADGNTDIISFMANSHAKATSNEFIVNANQKNNISINSSERQHKQLTQSEQEHTPHNSHSKVTSSEIISNKKQVAIDEELVLKCLSSSVANESDLIIALFDYGGQSVFNVIHHLFLTSNGVYVLAFNMEWLVAEGPNRVQCLDYMRFWLNSIAVHTMKEDGSTAPVVLVGTRKDRIRDAASHANISTLLFEAFQNNPCWPKLIENDKGEGIDGRYTFCFFPVDNTLGRGDPTIFN